MYCLFDSRDVIIEFHDKHESGCVLFCSFIIYRFSVLWLNFMSCICCSMLCCLYPLCFNLCISLVVIFLKFVSFEFVLRYLLVSMASFAAGGVV